MADTWIGFVLQVLQAKRTDQDFLSLRRKVYRRFAEEASRLAGPTCNAVSIRILNPYTRVLGFVECYSQNSAWTTEAKDTMYAPDQPSLGRKSLDMETTLIVPDVTKEKDYVKVIDSTAAIVIRRFKVQKVVRGVIDVDFDKVASIPTGFQSDFESLVSQLELVLAAIAESEEIFLGRLIKLFDVPKSEATGKAAYNNFVQRLRKVFKARGCSLFLVPEGKDQLNLEATDPPLKNGTHSNPYPFGVGLTGWVAENRKPRREKNTEPGTKFHDGLNNAGIVQENISYKDARGNRSFLAAPLMARDRVIGVIRLTIKETGEGLEEFTHEEETFLQDISNTVARQLDEHWLQESAEKKIAEQQKFAAFRQSLDEPRALGTLLAVELLNRPGVTGVFLAAGPKGSPSYIAGTAGTIKVVMAETGRVPVVDQRSIAENVWQSSEFGALKADFTAVFKQDVRQHVHAVAAVPLPFRNTRYGGWLLLSGDETMLANRDASDELSSHVAQALELQLVLADTRHSLERNVADLEKLRDLTKIFASTPSLELLSQRILSAFVTESGFDWGVIRLYDPEAKAWMRLALCGCPEEEYPLAIRADGLLGAFLHEKQLKLIPDTAAQTAWADHWTPMPEGPRRKHLKSVKSWVGIPLHFEGEHLGMIVLESPSARTLDPARQSFLRMIADNASLAFRTAVLLKAEQDLAQPLALIGSMMGGFLHVMRNCLNNIGPPLNLIKIPDLPIADQDRLHQTIGRERRRMEDVIRNIALLAAKRTGDEVVDLGLLAQRCIEELAIDFREPLRRIAITLDAKQGITIRGNRSQLEIALKMTIQNAIEALAADGGSLCIRVGQAKRRAFVMVSDSGPGMDPETKARCLKPFFTTKATGNGLGLPVTLGIIRRHAGRLRILTEPGRGTTFSMEFIVRMEAPRA